MSDEKIEDVTHNQSDSTQTTRRLPWRTMGILCTAFSIVVLLVVGGYSGWYLMRANLQMASLMSQSQNQLQQLQSDLNTLKAATQTAQEATQQSAEDLKNLKQIVTTLSQEKQGGQDQWRIVESRYYVKLANDNLQFSHDIASAMVLLKMADKEISQIADPKVAAIRKAIIMDLAALQNAPQLDISTLYMRFVALNNQLDQLPLQVNQAHVQQPPSAIEQNQTGWRHVVHVVWLTLQSLIVVRHNTNGSMPLMTPDQQVFLYQNLHAMVHQSIWALLHLKPVIYQTSLQQLANWVQLYFVQDAPITRSVLNTISQLKQVDINPPAIALMNTLQAYNGV